MIAIYVCAAFGAAVIAVRVSKFAYQVWRDWGVKSGPWLGLRWGY